MNFISVGDMARAFQMRHQGSAMRQEINRLNTELTTGRKLDTGAALRGDFSTLAGIEGSLTSLAAYKTTTTEATLVSGTMQTVLSGIRNLTKTAGPAMVSTAETASAAAVDARAGDARSRDARARPGAGRARDARSRDGGASRTPRSARRLAAARGSTRAGCRAGARASRARGGPGGLIGLPARSAAHAFDPADGLGWTAGVCVSALARRMARRRRPCGLVVVEWAWLGR